MKDAARRRGPQPGPACSTAISSPSTRRASRTSPRPARRSWDEIIAVSGVDRELIRKAADVYVESDRVIVCWAMGLTQHKNGVANIQEVVNLLLLRGNIGRPGAGACPVRGHSNVQGDRTMGIWERPPADFLDRLGRTFGFEPPREHGHDVVAAIKAMHDGEAHVFFGMGGNFAARRARHRLHRARPCAAAG